MKVGVFQETIEEVKLELLEKYEDVIYKENEIVRMTKNSETSKYVADKVIPDVVNLSRIENRFEIEGEIDAVKITYKVRQSGRRKYNNYYEYYEIF